MTPWHTIRTILVKELTDSFRDRRSLFNAAMLILFVPVLYIFMFGMLSAFITTQEDAVLDLPVQGAEYAPKLMAFLEDNEFNLVSPPADPEGAVRDRQVDVVLVIPEDYEDKFSAGRPVTIQLIVDETSQNNQITTGRVELALRQYSSQITALRLLARGVPLETLTPLDIETIDASTRIDRGFNFGNSILGLLPAIMLAVSMMSGLFMASDMIAGERERDSLEPLFMKPIPRWSIFAGKALTVFLFTQLGVIVSSAVYLLVLGLPFTQDLTGIQINLRPGSLLVSNLLIVPINFLAVGMQMLISAFVKSTREAQTYAQIVGLVGYLPSLFLSFLPVTQSAWMMLIPTISQYFLISEYMRSEPLVTTDILISGLTTLLLAILFYIVAIRLYYQERILIN